MRQKTRWQQPAASLEADSRGGKGLQFSDKDEHMYFWFPLLAGLSELTFDPRPDIRYSALEVDAPAAEDLLRVKQSSGLTQHPGARSAVATSPWVPQHLCLCVARAAGCDMEDWCRCSLTH